MLKRILKAGVVVGLVLALVQLGGLGNAFGAVIGWGLFGYLLWRAWPGVREDLGRLRLPSAGGRFARSGRARGGAETL